MALADQFRVYFFFQGETREYAYRRLSQVPRSGDHVQFQGERDSVYRIKEVVWCYSDPANDREGIRVHVVIEP